MQTKQLGRSDLAITPIGLGAWAIGGEWLFGWGPQDDADSLAVIKHAIDRGINWIDTAPAYGLGHSEDIVGRALADIPANVTAVRLHQEQSGLERPARSDTQPPAGLDPAGM